MYNRICYIYDYVIILLNMIMSYLIALYFIAMMTALDGYSYCDDYLVYSSDEDVKLKYTSKFIWYLDNRFCKIEIPFMIMYTFVWPSM